MDPAHQDLWNSILSNGPYAAAAAYLGKIILLAWNDDRAKLAAFAATSNATLIRVEVVLNRVCEVLERLLPDQENHASNPPKS